MSLTVTFKLYNGKTKAYGKWIDPKRQPEFDLLLHFDILL